MMSFFADAMMQDAYDNHLRYKFPLYDPQPVVRIPVAGPEPFNTLVVLRGSLMPPGGWASGRLERATYQVPTPLKLRDYDPLRPEQQTVQHSTTGAIRMLQMAPSGSPHIGDQNVTFTVAIDLIHPEAVISDTGQIILTIDNADQIWQRYGAFILQYSSWILCWEPSMPELAPPDIETVRVREGDRISHLFTPTLLETVRVREGDRISHLFTPTLGDISVKK